MAAVVDEAHRLCGDEDSEHVSSTLIGKSLDPLSRQGETCVNDPIVLDIDDARSETSERSSSSTIVIDPVAVADGIARLRVLADRERLTPDFLATTQRDGKGGVSQEGRRDLMIWLREFNLFFGLSPMTYAVASALVDRMLEETRVKPEHADLVGVACLLIAAKQNESEDLRPTLRELSRNCDGAFSESDIKRMEGLVLKRLGGLGTPSSSEQLVYPLEYLDEMIHFAMIVGVPASLIATASFDALTTNVVLSCSFHYELMSFRPSTLALTIFELELSRMQNDRFVGMVQEIQKVMAIPDWDIKNCRKAIARCLRLRPHLAV
mmetsp:Transcript_92237/g.128056  ORF Transcript_92237/g.128056 Transcript_92237/m.128056 type:complete len:322 (+) Transcript_92237:250-1215(+)